MGDPGESFLSVCLDDDLELQHHPGEREFGKGTHRLTQAYGLGPLKLSYVYTSGSLGLICSYVPLSTAMLKLGVKWGLLIGYSVCLVGLIFEYMLDTSSYLLMLGYFLCRFGALASTLGYGEAVSKWFRPDQRTTILLVIQSGLYLGYGLGHDILGFFVENHDDLSVADIRKGVHGFLMTMILCTLFAVLSILFTFHNIPEGDQLPLVELADGSYGTPEQHEQNQLLDNDKVQGNSSIVSSEPGKNQTSKDSDGTVVGQKSFKKQFVKLITDPIYLLILFGVLLGSNTIGGHNVAMAVMLKLFGVDESQTLGLANSGTIGGLLGIFGYAIFSKYHKKNMLHLIVILALFEVSLFMFWYSFFYPYKYIWATKFIYSLFNGPQGAIAIGIAIKYFNTVDPSLVLLGSGSINIVKYSFNALSGSFVGYIMQNKTKWNAIFVELVFQYAGAISFFSAVILAYKLAKKGIDVSSDAAKGRSGH